MEDSDLKSQSFARNWDVSSREKREKEKLAFLKGFFSYFRVFFLISGVLSGFYDSFTILGVFTIFIAYL